MTQNICQHLNVIYGQDALETHPNQGCFPHWYKCEDCGLIGYDTSGNETYFLLQKQYQK
jgi:hypothetical protein